MTERLLIFTDLDGTLLDHYSYQWQAAQTVLDSLQASKTPVILNTSKTRAELIDLRQQLGFQSPFISENGAAVHIPIGYFPRQPTQTTCIDGYWVKKFSQPKTHWLSLLNEHGTEFANCYRGFSQMSINSICQLTGLDAYQAQRAMQREYGEPLQWCGSEQQKTAFIEQMADLGINVLSGGRFIHLGGYCDKGQAQHWLAECYREHYAPQPLTTVSLGDSDNDIAMLEVADIAVRIRSPVHDFPQLSRQTQVFSSQAYGPQGWAEILKQLFPSIVQPSEQRYG